jgi:hypothetical protein
MGHAAVFAGIDFDVTIRGILVVLVGASVLIGSTWLLLMTNTGARLGTLIAFTGFFGWMFIMGIIWWMFGIGWKGPAPHWEVLDFNYNQLQASPVTAVHTLRDPTTLPDAHQLVVERGNEEARKEFASDIPADRLEGLDPAEQAAARADWQAKNLATTLSDVASVDPALTKDIDWGDSWKLMSTAENGEAAAAASAALVEHGNFANATDFKVLDAFQKGGKPRLPANPSRWDRITRKIDTIVNFRHPPHYAVVQVQQVIPQETQPGEAPPRPKVDPNQPIISVVMERNLGALRIHSAFITVGSLLLFIVGATMLHYRDKESMARRAALSGKG